MFNRRGFGRVVVACGIGLLLASCGQGGDRPPDYRYRLTVEVDTPEGLRSGSSVIEVTQRMVRPGSNPAGTAVERRARGEAVAVDLPDGRTLFALLRSDNDIDWASYVMQVLGPNVEGESFEQQLDDMLALEGVIVLPRTFPPVGHLDERSAYPMLVTFADESDPTSAALVDPDDLAATFGEGVSLRRITVEMTDDPVTTGIEKRLGWLTDPVVMENPGWRNLPLDVRKILIGLRAGKVGSES